ncbi:MAG: FCD domain-containing protein, partial [Atribacterota bacterium]|nr:FCD domain-containing protein [Atribacterota bacterium]
TKNQTLAETLKRLRNQIGRLWFFAKEHDAYSQEIPEDFEELIKALEKKDQSKSEQIMKNHAIQFINQIKISLYTE